MAAGENHISNYYLLERLAHYLDSALKDAALRECFSINKNELILQFDDQFNRQFYLKCFLGEQSFVFFPESVGVKPKDKKIQFAALQDKRVLQVRSHSQDRSFRIDFQDNFSLVFMLYGRNGNVVLFEDENVATLFKTKFEKHAELKLSDFTTISPPDFEKYKNLVADEDWQEAVAALFPALTKQMLSEIAAGLTESDPISQWQMISELEKALAERDIYLAEDQRDGLPIGIRLLLTKPEQLYKSYTNISEALNEYAYRYLHILRFNSLRTNALQSLEEQLRKAEQTVASSKKHLDSLEKDKNYRHQADIIMANLHQLEAGTEEAELYDFYQDRNVKIKLKRGLSPQSWAEKLYQKAKSQEIEKEKTLERLLQAEEESITLKSEIQRISQAHDLKVLKETIRTSEIKENEPVSPFKRFEIEGYEVYVGKNAVNNDKLTFGFAHKEDMWLHARDVSGSHVVIKHKQKDIFPASVLERAAEIAAYYSKSKQSSLCPVIYTHKKFVRKPKGAPAGAVIAEKEKALLVEPKLPESLPRI
jgi:predicted ribosome quality control (RQC) complex YloA/Tae2 family protein